MNSVASGSNQSTSEMPTLEDLHQQTQVNHQIQLEESRQLEHQQRQEIIPKIRTGILKRRDEGEFYFSLQNIPPAYYNFNSKFISPGQLDSVIAQQITEEWGYCLDKQRGEVSWDQECLQSKSNPSV